VLSPELITRREESRDGNRFDLGVFLLLVEKLKAHLAIAVQMDGGSSVSASRWRGSSRAHVQVVNSVAGRIDVVSRSLMVGVCFEFSSHAFANLSTYRCS
jgi:hypothetical protein